MQKYSNNNNHPIPSFAVSGFNDSLTIYIRGINNKITVPFNTLPVEEGYYTSHLIEYYQEQFPNVALNVVNLNELSEEQFYDKISTEIMAGRGPDVIVGTEEFMKYRDVKKMIKSGAFAEIDKFIKSDKDQTFSPENSFDNINPFLNQIYEPERYSKDELSKFIKTNIISEIFL